MNTNLKTLGLGVAALSVAALAFSAPASAQQTSRHHASAHQTLQSDAYGSVNGPEYQRAPLPYSARTVVGTDPDSNVRLELQRDPPNDR